MDPDALREILASASSTGSREFGGFESLEAQLRAFDLMQQQLYRTTGFKTGSPPGPRNPGEDGRPPIPWDERSDEDRERMIQLGLAHQHPLFPPQQNIIERSRAGAPPNAPAPDPTPQQGTGATEQQLQMNSGDPKNELEEIQVAQHQPAVPRPVPPSGVTTIPLGTGHAVRIHGPPRTICDDCGRMMFGAEMRNSTCFECREERRQTGGGAHRDAQAVDAETRSQDKPPTAAPNAAPEAGPNHPKKGQLVDSTGSPSQQIYVEQAQDDDPMGLDARTKFQRTSYEDATPLAHSYLQTCYGARAKSRYEELQRESMIYDELNQELSKGTISKHMPKHLLALSDGQLLRAVLKDPNSFRFIEDHLLERCHDCELGTSPIPNDDEDPCIRCKGLRWLIQTKGLVYK